MAVSSSLCIGGGAYDVIPSPPLPLPISSIAFTHDFTLNYFSFTSSSIVLYLPGHKLGFAILKENNYVNAYTFGLSEREKSIPVICQTLLYDITLNLPNKLKR